jgi:hypothetical protein
MCSKFAGMPKQWIRFWLPIRPIHLTERNRLTHLPAFWRYQSNLGWATGWTIGVLGFDSLRGLGIFLFTTASRTAQRPTQPPIQWVPGPLSLEVKRSGRESDHSPPSSAEVKNAWSYTSTSQYVFMAWCLVKHSDNFTFTEFRTRTTFIYSYTFSVREELMTFVSLLCTERGHVHAT